jgi:hypothetical protein
LQLDFSPRAVFRGIGYDARPFHIKRARFFMFRSIVAGSVLAVLLSFGFFGVAPSPVAAQSCTPGYSPCIPNKPSDVDCYGGSGNGPRYTRPGVVYKVQRGKDRYGLDSDHDGKGCER